MGITGKRGVFPDERQGSRAQRRRAATCSGRAYPHGAGARLRGHAAALALAGLCAPTLGACGVVGSDDALAYQAGPDLLDAGTLAEARRGAKLMVSEGRASSLELEHPSSATLEVVLNDREGQPISGGTVSFALEGEAGGASLADLSVTTDDHGVAATMLYTGPTGAEFEVRATASGADPLYIPVTVTAAEVTELQVELAYAGARSFDRQVVLLYQGATCETLRTASQPSPPAYEIDVEEDSLEPLEDVEVEPGTDSLTMEVPAAGGRISVRALGLGPYDNLLASGCTGMDPLSTDDSRVRVVLEDASVRLEGTYPLRTAFDVDRSSERLADALRDTKHVTLGTYDHPSGARLLNAIEDTLSADGATTEATSLAVARADSEGPSLDAALEQHLGEAGVGLGEVIDRLVSAIRQGGSRLEVLARLSAVGSTDLELGYTPVLLTAVGDADETPLALWFGPERDVREIPGSIGADFDTARSLLTIDTLRVELPLGAYGQALVYALGSSEIGALREILVGRAGCGELEDWVGDASHPSLAACEGDCVARACNLAIDELLEESMGHLSLLDERHASIGLRGDVPVYDANGDGVAERIGETPLEGSWGRERSATNADAVTATLSAASGP